MITTLDKVKTQLWISWTDEDILLTQLLTQADWFIKKYCNKVIEATDITEIVNGNWERIFTPKNYPIISLTSFQYNSWDIATPTRENFDNNSYWLNNDTWEIYSKQYIPKGINNIKVVYTAWYNPIPDDLQNACISLVGYYYNTRNSQGVARESLDGASIEYSNTANVMTVPSEILQILNFYKKYYV